MASYNIITTPYDAGRYHVNVAYEGTLNGRPVTPLERIEHLVYGIICLIPLINIIAERILFAMGKHTLEALSAREVETRPPAPLQPTDVKDETLIPFDIEVTSCLDPEDVRYMLLKLVDKVRETVPRAETRNYTFLIDKSKEISGRGFNHLIEGGLDCVKEVMGKFLDRAKSWLECNPGNKMNISLVMFDKGLDLDITWQQLTRDKVEEVRQQIMKENYYTYCGGGKGSLFGCIEFASNQMDAMAKADPAATNFFVCLIRRNEDNLHSGRSSPCSLLHDIVISDSLIRFHHKIKEHAVNLYALSIDRYACSERMGGAVTMDVENARYGWIKAVEVGADELSPGQTTLTRAIGVMFNLADPHFASNIQCKLTAASGTVELALKTPDENGVFSLGELFHERESSFLFTVGDNRELKLELTYDVNGQKYRVQRTLTLRDSGNRQEMLDRVLKRELANYYKDIDTIEDLDQKLAMTKAIIERIKNLDSCTRGDEWSEGLLHIITGDLMNRESGFELKLEEAASGIKEANPLVSNLGHRE